MIERSRSRSSLYYLTESSPRVIRELPESCARVREVPNMNRDEYPGQDPGPCRRRDRHGVLLWYVCLQPSLS